MKRFLSVWWLAVDVSALVVSALLVAFAGAAPSLVVSVVSVLVAVRAGRRARDDQDDDDHDPPPPTTKSDSFRLGSAPSANKLRDAASASSVIAVLVGAGRAVGAALRGRPARLHHLLVGAALAVLVSCGSIIERGSGAAGAGGSGGVTGSGAGSGSGSSSSATAGGPPGGQGGGGNVCALPDGWTAVDDVPCCYQAAPCIDEITAAGLCRSPARPVLCVGQHPTCETIGEHVCDGQPLVLACCAPGAL